MAGLPAARAVAPSVEDQFAALCCAILAEHFPPGTPGRVEAFKAYGEAAGSATFYVQLCDRYGVPNIVNLAPRTPPGEPAAAPAPPAATPLVPKQPAAPPPAGMRAANLVPGPGANPVPGPAAAARFGAENRADIRERRPSRSRGKGDKGDQGHGKRAGKGPGPEGKRGRAGSVVNQPRLIPANNLAVVEGEPGGKFVKPLLARMDGAEHTNGEYGLDNMTVDRMYWLHVRVVDALRHFLHHRALKTDYVNWATLHGLEFFVNDMYKPKPATTVGELAAVIHRVNRFTNRPLVVMMDLDNKRHAQATHGQSSLNAQPTQAEGCVAIGDNRLWKTAFLNGPLQSYFGDEVVVNTPTHLRHFVMGGAVPGILGLGIRPRHQMTSGGRTREPLAIMLDAMEAGAVANAVNIDITLPYSAEVILDVAAVIRGQKLYVSRGKAIFAMDTIGVSCITHVRYVGMGRYYTAKEVVNTAPYLLCVRKVDELTRKQKAILDNTGCANKGRDNGPFARKGSGKTKEARYKCEMCENWTDFGDCRYADKCDFFHKGPDDILPWWPHEAKLHHWLRLQGERGLGYAEAAVISDEEEEHSDAANAEALSEDVVMGGQGNLAPDCDPLAASSGGAAAGAAAGSGGSADNLPPARRSGRSRSASNKIRRRPAAHRGVNLSDSESSDQDRAPLV